MFNKRHIALLQNSVSPDEALLEVLFYAVLFNDIGKNKALKHLLQSNYQIKEQDHDLLFEHAMHIDGVLKDFSQLNADQQHCLRTLWCNGFNVSSFDTLEYSPAMIVNWVILFADKAKENLDTYLLMKKIEILFDIAGANGNRCRGASNLTEPVALKFEKSFALGFFLVSDSKSPNFIRYHVYLNAWKRTGINDLRDNYSPTDSR